MNRSLLALLWLSSAALGGWERPIGGSLSDEAHAVATDCDSVYVGGYLASVGLETPGAGAHVGALDGYVARFQRDGGLVWLSYYGGSEYDSVEALDVDPAGNVYVVGYTYSTDWLEDPQQAASRDGFVMKLSPLGQVLWRHRFNGPGGSDEMLSGVAAAGTAGAYFCGFSSTNSPLPRGEWTRGWQGGRDAVVGFIDSEGNFLWLADFGSDGDDFARGIAADPAGGAVVIGDTDPNSVAFPTTRAAPFSGSNREIFLLRVSPTGGLDWSYTLGGSSIDLGNAIRWANGQLYACGVAGPGLFGPAGGGPDSDMVVMRLDGNGLVQRMVRVGGLQRDECQDVAVAPSGDVFAVGWTISTSADYGDAGLDYDAPGGSGDNIQVIQLGGPDLVRGTTWVRGGDGGDRGLGAVYVDNTLYVVGQTNSQDFPEGGRGSTDQQGFLLMRPASSGAGCVENEPDAGAPPDAGTGRLPALGWSCGCASGGGPLFAALGLALVLQARRGKKNARVPGG